MAVLTITTTAQEDAQVQFAVGRTLGLADASNLPRDATLPECKQFIIDYMKSLVRLRRQEESLKSFVAPVINPT